MGQKELKKAVEELKPLGGIVLTALLSPLIFVMAILLYAFPLVLLIFGPLLRLFFGPKSDETETALIKHPRADDRILPTAHDRRSLEPRPKDLVLPSESPEGRESPVGRWEDDGGGPR